MAMRAVPIKSALPTAAEAPATAAAPSTMGPPKVSEAQQTAAGAALDELELGRGGSEGIERGGAQDTDRAQADNSKKRKADGEARQSPEVATAVAGSMGKRRASPEAEVQAGSGYTSQMAVHPLSISCKIVAAQLFAQ